MGTAHHSSIRWRADNCLLIDGTMNSTSWHCHQRRRRRLFSSAPAGRKIGCQTAPVFTFSHLRSNRWPRPAAVGRAIFYIIGFKLKTKLLPLLRLRYTANGNRRRHRKNRNVAVRCRAVGAAPVRCVSRERLECSARIRAKFIPFRKATAGPSNWYGHCCVPLCPCASLPCGIGF